MKRQLVVLLLLALAAAVCFAVGQQEEAEKVELRYMMWDPQIVEKEEALAVKFSQDNPNVSVTIETAVFAQFWELYLMVSPAVGHGEDVARGHLPVVEFGITLGFLGLFYLAFEFHLKRHRAVPLKDPFIQECLEYHPA